MEKSFARLLLLALLAAFSTQAPGYYPPYGYQQPGRYP